MFMNLVLPEHDSFEKHHNSLSGWLYVFSTMVIILTVLILLCKLSVLLCFIVSNGLK